MAQNEFDQACRYAAKLDSDGFLAWLLRLERQAFLFRGWLDTRTIPFPGEADRTCDTVAHLEETTAGHVPWAVTVEFQIEPDAAMFGRLLVYNGRLWLECRPDPERGSRFHVGATVVNLTGRGDGSRSFNWRQARLRTEMRLVERNLASERAAPVLRDIAKGKWSRCLLPWIPLMQGSEQPGIIQKWKELASAEPDERRRGDYGGLALVFAEAARRRQVWQQVLKEWNMIRSQQVQEWKAEARAEGRAESQAAAVIDLLNLHFGSVPDELGASIRSTTDLATLQAWFTEAYQASSLADFRQKTGL